MSDKKHKPVHAPVETEGFQNQGVTGMQGGKSNQMLLEQLFDRQRSTPVQAGRAGAMFQDLKYSLPQEMPGSQPGTMDRYNLSFRDRSGYRGSTSEAFMNKAGGGSKWKGLRLDHPPPFP